MKEFVRSLMLASLAFCFPGVTAFAQVAMDKTSYSPKEVAFITGVRESYAQNLTWERVFVIERVANSPDTDKAKQRLLASENNIASIIKPYYGDDAGSQFGLLLNQFVQSLDDYTNIVRSGVGDKMAVITAMNDNTTAIANFLCIQNMYWNRDEMTASLKKYTDLLVAEINLQYPNVGTVDSASFDATFSQAMSLADIISLGTIKQFPSKFW